MQIRAAIALQAIIKSIADVVLPGVDPANRLALEQGRLVVGLLTLIADRLPLQPLYDIDELRRLCRLGATLRSNEPDPEITAVLKRAEDVLARATAAPMDLYETIGALTAAIGDRVQVLALQAAPSNRAARVAVLAAAREQQVRERSWLIMQGWETDAASIPAIDRLLGTTPLPEAAP
jgi:hypothetical protein